MASVHINDDNEPGFFRRHLVLLILGGLGLAGGGYLYVVDHTPSKAAPKKKEMTFIIYPEPEPVKQQVKKEEKPREEKKEEKDDKMIVQEEVKPQETKAAAPAPDKPSNELLGTAIGGGDGSLGNGSGNGNGGPRMIGGNNGGGGSKWGWYAGQVQNRLADALRSNPVTQRAGFSNTIQIWSDNTGRITRVKLNSSTGDGKVDAAIENEVFNGLVLNEPPPEGMPMPINLRLTAR